MASLTPSQQAAFLRDGYLVLPSFAPHAATAALRARAAELVAAHAAAAAASGTAATVFSPETQSHAKDANFFKSAYGIHCFDEAEHRARRAEEPAEHAVNKIGHALHDIDPVFRDFTHSEAVTGVVASLFRRPVVVQSMYIFKKAHVGGEVTPHRDSTYLYTDPPSCVGLWWALQDATRENGCLWVVPGSHVGGVRKRMVRKAEDELGIEFRGGEEDPWDEEKGVALECPEGSMVMLHGAVLHMSKDNDSDKSREAYTVHVVESEGAEWSKENWLQRPAGIPFVGFEALRGE